MNATAQAALLTRLRIQRRTRMARRGDLGPAIKALHDTADAMDARQRRMSPYRTPGGRMYWPVERHEVHNVLLVAEHGVFGAASMREFEAEWRQRKQQDRIAVGQWLKEGMAALKSIEPLLAPDGYDSPDLSSGDLRAIADRLTAEAMPLPSDVKPGEPQTAVQGLTQAAESGASLRAAGWHTVAQRAARAGWNTPSRPRGANGSEYMPRTLWEAAS